MKEASIPREKLRELNPEDRKNLLNLKERLKKIELDPREVGEILPEAVIAGEESQNSISRSMVEVTERAINLSIRRDPDILAKALFPIIGSAIKRAMRQIMAEMMLTLNKGMTKTFSLKRLGWRIESIRTGVPFMQIVLSNTLLYQVDHILLIHKKTKLLLHSVSAPNAFMADNDIVASMLTVIRDYIKDSLSLGHDEAVNTISTDGYNIYIEDGPEAIMAAVVKGIPDARVRDSMQETLEAIHIKLSSTLKSFSGKTDVFVKEEKLLQLCLLSKEKESNAKPVYALLFTGLLGALLVWLFISWGVFAYKSRDFTQSLSADPGIMVTSSHFGPFKGKLQLLRDPRVPQIEDRMEKAGLDSSRYEITEKTFISPELGPLFAGGIPPELQNLAQKLKEQVVFFKQDSGDIEDNQEEVLQKAIEMIIQLIETAKGYNLPVTVEITGHSAGLVQDAESIRVSRERAEKVLHLLENIKPELTAYVIPKGVGIKSPLVPEEKTEEDKRKNRSVTFEAAFE